MKLLLCVLLLAPLSLFAQTPTKPKSDTLVVDLAVVHYIKIGDVVYKIKTTTTLEVTAPTAFIWGRPPITQGATFIPLNDLYKAE